MARQIIVSFNRVGASGRDSMANFLAGMANEVEAVTGAAPARKVGMLARSPWSAAHAFVEDGDTPQDVADALAQAVFDEGVAGPFAASDIDSAGAITELTAPTPS
ncbi:MAG TPA: hypothetical protein VMZ50_14185 [Phycisphaerae bacterium]|nr:hypothetical protein [Phycisphaerae bacterium]